MQVEIDVDNIEVQVRCTKCDSVMYIVDKYEYSSILTIDVEPCEECEDEWFCNLGINNNGRHNSIWCNKYNVLDAYNSSKTIMEKQLIGTYKKHETAQFVVKSMFRPEDYPITVYYVKDGVEIPKRIIYEDGTEEIL